MKTIIKILLICSVVLVGCRKDELSLTEKKIAGEWEFEKVKYNDANIILNEDITSEYSGSILTFFNDGTANFNHQNKIYEGVWEVTINPQLNDAYENLTVNLSEINSNELLLFNFNNVSVTKNIIWAHKYNYNKRFTYKLKRK